MLEPILAYLLLLPIIALVLVFRIGRSRSKPKSRQEKPEWPGNSECWPELEVSLRRSRYVIQKGRPREVRLVRVGRHYQKESGNFRLVLDSRSWEVSLYGRGDCIFRSREKSVTDSLTSCLGALQRASRKDYEAMMRPTSRKDNPFIKPFLESPFGRMPLLDDMCPRWSLDLTPVFTLDAQVGESRQEAADGVWCCRPAWIISVRGENADLKWVSRSKSVSGFWEARGYRGFDPLFRSLILWLETVNRAGDAAGKILQVERSDPLSWHERLSV